MLSSPNIDVNGSNYQNNNWCHFSILSSLWIIRICCSFSSFPMNFFVWNITEGDTLIIYRMRTNPFKLNKIVNLVPQLMVRIHSCGGKVAEKSMCNSNRWHLLDDNQLMLTNSNFYNYIVVVARDCSKKGLALCFTGYKHKCRMIRTPRNNVFSRMWMQKQEHSGYLVKCV